MEADGAGRRRRPSAQADGAGRHDRTLSWMTRRRRPEQGPAAVIDATRPCNAGLDSSSGYSEHTRIALLGYSRTRRHRHRRGRMRRPSLRHAGRPCSRARTSNCRPAHTPDWPRGSRTVAHSVVRFLMHAARASPFPCSVGTLCARLGVCACPRPCICTPCVQHSAHCVRLRVLRCKLNGNAHPADAARITHDVPSAFALRRRCGQAARERRGRSDARQSRRFRRRRLRRHRRRRRRLPLWRCGGHVGSGSARRR